MSLEELEEQLKALTEAWREHIAQTERIQAISAREAMKAIVGLGPPPAAEKP